MDELTENEKMLIEALREMNEIPINMLLWYSNGLKHSVEKAENTLGKLTAEPHVSGDKRKIEICKKYYAKMN